MTSSPKKAPEIGSRLQSLRKQQGLSLDDMASRSKVSRSMLSQVERGLANPTFATLWALTQALGVEISSLISEPQHVGTATIDLVEAHNTPRIQSADGHCLLQILSPAETTGELEWYRLEIDQGASLTSQPHASGSREHLSVLVGDALVTSGDAQQKAGAGATLRYRADMPHSISNIGTGRLEALLVVLPGN